MPDKHAFLSPSSAERWYHCNKSAWLCEQFPDLGSVFAAEGTEAHSLCEYLLGVSPAAVTKALAKIAAMIRAKTAELAAE